MVFLVIRLVGEEQDRLFTNIILEPQISRLELVKRIESVTQIPPEFQQIEFRGEELPVVEHPLQAIKFGEELVVKHALFQNWAVFLQRYKRLKRLRTSDEQGDMAHTLLRMVDILKTGGFFFCYVNIGIVCDEICEDVREYLGGFRETIEMAARYFFFNLKKNGRPDASVFKIRFDEKLAGVHSGRLCTVTDHDETTTYHIKTNYGGPKKSSSRSGMPPNLREVFGYSLLQLIGVGPESHFFCPPPGTSTRTIFIATKAIPNFESNRMDQLTRKSKNIKNVLIEIHVLCSIFCITDVHQDNCGQLNGQSIIIDFAIPFREGYQRENVCQLVCEGTPALVDTLVNGVSNIELRKVAEACSSDERIKIARAAIDKWSLMDAIESAKVRTNAMKEIMVAQGITIEKTEDFAQYVADVKYNCSLFL